MSAQARPIFVGATAKGARLSREKDTWLALFFFDPQTVLWGCESEENNRNSPGLSQEFARRSGLAFGVSPDDAGPARSWRVSPGRRAA